MSFEFERARVVSVCAEGDPLVMASLGFGGIGTERRRWTCALNGVIAATMSDRFVELYGMWMWRSGLELRDWPRVVLDPCR